MKKAFSLAEILVVVAILGILAAIVVPKFQGQALEAKEAAAKANLHALRNIIESYAARNNGIAPGYPGNDTSQSVGINALRTQLITDGKYIRDYPKNPLNNSNVFLLIQNNENFPSEAVEGGTVYGWVYKPATKTIQLNTPGVDSSGVRYFDY